MNAHLAAVFIVLFPILYVSALLHEAGHTLAARLSGIEVTSMGMGLAGPFRVFGWRGTRLFFCRKNPFLGLTLLFAPQIFPLRWQWCFNLAGGYLMNLFLFLGSLALWQLLPWGGWFWNTATWVNGLLVMSGLIPYSFKSGAAVIKNDAAQILYVLRNGDLDAGSAPARVLATSSFSDLCRAIGDEPGLSVRLVAGAMAWSELRDHERTNELLLQADAIDSRASRSVHAFYLAGRGLAAARAGKRDLAESSLAQAEEEYRALGYEGGMLLAALGRLELRINGGEYVEADAELVRIAALPILTRLSVMQAAIAGWRCIVLSGSGADGVEASLAEYEAARGGHPLDTMDVRVYRAMARWRAGRKQWTDAVSMYRSSLDSLQRLREGFTETADQERLLEINADLIAEARDCLQQAGQERPDEAISELLPPSLEVARRCAETSARRDRRFHRWGIFISVANLFIALVMTAFDLWIGLGWRVHSLVNALLFCFILVMLYSSWLFLAARIFPSRRGTGGVHTFLLSLLPWLFWPILIAII